MNRLKYSALIALLMVGFAARAGSGFVVIASNGTDFSPGAIVASEQDIELKADQSLKLLASDGRLVDLEGPYRGQPAAAGEGGDDGLLESLARVVEAAHSSDLTLAAFRAGSYDTARPRGDIWGVDIGQPGKYCRRSDLPLMLWWPDAVKGAGLRLTRVSNSQSAEFDWRDRKRQARWPADFESVDGETYRVAIDLSAQHNEFTLATIPAGMENDAVRLVWMSEQGCAQQSLRLLADLIGRKQ